VDFARCGTVFSVSVVVGAVVPAGYPVVPALSWCGEVSLGEVNIFVSTRT